MAPDIDIHSTATAVGGKLMLDAQNRPVTILLVDDDPDCRLLIKDAISECRVQNEILEAANGQEALDLLHRRGKYENCAEPGLIYMDIEMPLMDGLTALEQIKADPQLRQIPVVMMTGVSDAAHMRRAAVLGANSYTLKPANAEQFLNTVLASTNYWLSVHQSPQNRLPQAVCRR
ncbi:MAG: response regulator [Burkholderiales bacterium]|nr:response regulator [Phycisphaerae bacterium]